MAPHARTVVGAISSHLQYTYYHSRVRYKGGVDDLDTSSASYTLTKVIIQYSICTTYYTKYFQNQTLKFRLFNSIDTQVQ